MSSAYERLINLFSQLGLNVENGSRARAEANALATGCDLVRQGLENSKGLIFILGEQGNARLFADMMKLNFSLMSAGELKAFAVSALSHGFGECELSGALESEIALLDGAGVETQNGVVTVSSLTAKGLRFLGRFCSGGVPFNLKVELPFSGMSFSEWDSKELTFRELDGLRLPFSCIDTLTASLV